MKMISGILVIAILTGLFLRILPWWSGSIIAFGIGVLLRQGAGRSFLAGFAGVALAWVIVAGWIDVQNASILSKRIGTLFMGISPLGVLAVTAVIGGLTGGFGAMTGGALRTIKQTAAATGH